MSDGPGAGMTGNRDKPAGAGTSKEAQAGAAADSDNLKKAGDLQLEEFKKKKDIAINKLHWTEEQWQQFLNDYQAMLKRRQAEPAGAEALPDPRRGGGSLSNTGVQRVTGGSGQEGGAQYRGPALPPPQFREAQKEWSEKVSGMDREAGRK